MDFSTYVKPTHFSHLHIVGVKSDGTGRELVSDGFTPETINDAVAYVIANNAYSRAFLLFDLVSGSNPKYIKQIKFQNA